MSLIVSRDPLFYAMAIMAAGLPVGTLLTLGVVPVRDSMAFALRGSR